MLRLTFKDETGQERSVDVDKSPFTIGRHSACDLCYPDSRLSREHARIDDRDGEYSIVDAGSSNGTTVNGSKLFEARLLKDGDEIDLGGGLQIRAIITPPGGESADPAGADLVDAAPVSPGVPAPLAPSPAFNAAPPSAGEGIPTSFFIIAPLLAIFVLAILILGIVLLGGGDRRVAGTDSNEDDPISTTDDNGDEPDVNGSPTPRPERSPTPAQQQPANNGSTTPDTPSNTDPPPNIGGSDTAKVEQNGAAFIRQIAQNDPKAFLTGEQAKRVDVKLKQISKSVLADNISSARKNTAAIRSLAAQKNLKPEFLAIAAITKLGGSRGDVLQAAQGIADVYDKLAIHIGSENFDDALLMVAAYDQGAAGDPMRMRNMLQDLATKSQAGAREIRTIWFLEKNGKITASEYDRALSFLAIGTIAQNPKDFGVNTEALRL